MTAEHSVSGVFPDRSTESRAKVEDRLDQYIDFYQKAVEQNGWYGFWNYGDFMHAYDPVRHEWKYDVGGFAWDNTELGSNLWLWYSSCVPAAPTSGAWPRLWAATWAKLTYITWRQCRSGQPPQCEPLGMRCKKKHVSARHRSTGSCTTSPPTTAAAT